MSQSHSHPPDRASDARRRRCSPGATLAIAQPTFGNPSPTAGSETSQKANAAGRPGALPAGRVHEREQEGPGADRHSRRDQEQQRDVPAEVHAPTTSPTSARSSSPTPTSRCSSAPTSGPLLNEFALAYNLGDPNAARKFLGMGKLKTHQVRREVRHPEDRAGRGRAVRASTAARSARWPGCSARLGGSRGGAQAGAVGGTAIGSVQTGESTGVWIIGMRYKIINAETTEQLAQGYTEEKMEVGATSTSVLGVSAVAAGRRRRSTRWCSGWSRSRSGKSTTSTSERATAERRDAGPPPASRFEAAATLEERAWPISEARQVRDPPRARPRRDGRRLRGLRPDDRARRRAQDDPRRPARRRARAARSSRASAARRRRPGGCTHPNIVSIYDFGEDAGVWYIAMEFVKGRELKDYFEAQRALRDRRHRAHHDADPRRARLLAQARRRPPRHQAGERHPARRRHASRSPTSASRTSSRRS